MADQHPESGVVDWTTLAPTPGLSATKRKMESDMLQPADKKAKTVLTGEPDAGFKRRSTPGCGILAMMANRFSTPFPCADSQFVQVQSVHMTGYFGTIWDSLVNAIYPDSSFEPMGLISRENFILVCRYLTKARVDHVYASSSGVHPQARITIPLEFKVPKCLSDILNGIGTYTINSGALMVIPKPEAPPEDASTALHNTVRHTTLTAFSSLVRAGNDRGFIRVSTIGSVIPGNAWWLLTARDPTNAAIIANNIDRVQVLASFHEWTPSDGLMCAIVQRQYDGLIPVVGAGLTWSFDTVRDISGYRNKFNLKA